MILKISLFLQYSLFIIAIPTIFLKVGEKAGVEADMEDLNKNKGLFKLHVKAQIARKLWNNEGFYPIFNETNEILQQAVKLFDRVEEELEMDQGEE